MKPNYTIFVPRKGTKSRVSFDRIFGMKADVLASLGLASSDRTDAVFQSAVEVCFYQSYEGADEHTSSLRYLTATMKSKMDQGAYEHLSNEAKS